MSDIDEVLDAELTQPQRDVVRDPATEILTLACAGSGKSRTLAYRIAWLIADRGIDPSCIVAFTFTEKAADSIQLRVATALEKVGIAPTVLGRIHIGTIHGYCKELLGRIDAAYRQYDVLDSNRLVLYLMSRYPQLHLPALRSARGSRYFQTIREVSDAWTVANDEMVDLDRVATLDPDLGASLHALREQLDEDRFIDFSLMIRLVTEALEVEHTGAVDAISGLQYLLVDEYQDINPLQERLIRQLHHRAENLMVVGDDDQAIYAWRGADVDHILDFERRHPGCSSHTLAHNFRSTPPMVDTADAFVSAELGPSRTTKDPTADDGTGVRDFRNLWFPDRPSEAAWVAEQVQALIGTEYHEADGTVRGLTPADFAILMRSTRGSERDGSPRHDAFTRELEARGIPYTLEQGGGVFDRPQVAALRDTFELLRDESPRREDVRQHVEETVRPAFPNADFRRTVDVLAEWGRLVHTPTSVERRRVYPQQLLHELLAAFGLAETGFDEGTMADIGVFSRMLQDVETVYVSIDTAGRFQSVLNFLQQVAENGYDSSTSAVLRRPNAVSVSTVHRAKGLEFPAVFVVDVEGQRFPMNRSRYDGWLPSEVMASAISRGAYGNDRQQEARLFYTALTRAERYLYVSGSEQLPDGRRPRRSSPFAGRLQHPEISVQPAAPYGLVQCQPRRRVDETIVPTTFSEIRYYLRCPRDYQFRNGWGFSPPITEMFGFGQAVHAAVGKLHEQYPTQAPAEEDAESVARDIFHLKHVPPSQDPQNRPGAFEQAQERAADILKNYAKDYVNDFAHERQVEVPFEVPVEHAVINGAIDLLLRHNDSQEIVGGKVIDFKAIEGGAHPVANNDLDWTELALQVQLYAMAAREVLGEQARTGAVHLLKDGQRISVPVDDEAVRAAVANVEWAVERVIAGDVPMRPHRDKCAECDWNKICPRRPESFENTDRPPDLHLPQPLGPTPSRAFGEFEGDSSPSEG